MTVAADPPLTSSFPQIFSSNEIVSQEALFTRKDTEAVREPKWLFRLLGTVNLLVLAVGVFSGLILAVAIARSLLPGWATELQSATTILGVAITAFTILATTLGQFVRDGDRSGRWRTLRSEAELAPGRSLQRSLVLLQLLERSQHVRRSASCAPTSWRISPAIRTLPRAHHLGRRRRDPQDAVAGSSIPQRRELKDARTVRAEVDHLLRPRSPPRWRSACSLAERPRSRIFRMPGAFYSVTVNVPSSSSESSIVWKYREHTEPIWPCAVQMERGR
jgi:hypothetical protein